MAARSGERVRGNFLLCFDFWGFDLFIDTRACWVYLRLCITKGGMEYHGLDFSLLLVDR